MNNIIRLFLPKEAISFYFLSFSTFVCLKTFS